MRRIHLFEFEDLPWLPRSLRAVVTHALEVMNNALGVYDTVSPLLIDVLERAGEHRVVDLCSGSGGPWSRLHRRVLERVPDVQITLTDRYPQPAAATRWSADTPVTYHPDPIDAARVPASLPGVRTVFTGFHHFKPPQATAILRDAVASRAPIAIFEFTRRRLRNALLAAVAGGIGLPFVVPWLRPLRATHLLWSFVLPVAPLVYAWDGAISNLRTYTPAELAALAHEAGGDAYRWDVGELSAPRAPAPITYLIGLPVEGA